MAVTLTPSQAGSATNPAGDKIGVANTNDFVVYLWRYPFRFYSRVFEKTGGGDQYPVYSNRGDLEGRISIIGVAVAEEAIGIANLIDTAKNPATNVTLILDGARKLVITIFLEDIQGEWNRKSGYMPIRMTGYLHNTNPSNIEAAI